MTAAGAGQLVSSATAITGPSRPEGRRGESFLNFLTLVTVNCLSGGGFASPIRRLGQRFATSISSVLPRLCPGPDFRRARQTRRNLPFSGPGNVLGRASPHNPLSGAAVPPAGQRLLMNGDARVEPDSLFRSFGQSSIARATDSAPRGSILRSRAGQLTWLWSRSGGPAAWPTGRSGDVARWNTTNQDWRALQRHGVDALEIRGGPSCAVTGPRFPAACR
jgi:hypothetical protein